MPMMTAFVSSAIPTQQKTVVDQIFIFLCRSACPCSPVCIYGMCCLQCRWAYPHAPAPSQQQDLKAKAFHSACLISFFVTRALYKFKFFRKGPW